MEERPAIAVDDERFGIPLTLTEVCSYLQYVEEYAQIQGDKERERAV